MMGTKALFDAAPKRLFALVVSALVISVTVQDAVAQNAERSGKGVVESLCVSCHGTGARGAPKIGDEKAWSKLAARAPVPWHETHSDSTTPLPLRSAF